MAASSSSINVTNFVSEKLKGNRNSNNYKSWKQQMICLLQSQGLAGFIDGKAPPPPPNDAVEWRRRTDWLVKGWILGALGEDALQNVVNLDSARDVWLELETKFSTPNSHYVVPPPNSQPPASLALNYSSPPPPPPAGGQQAAPPPPLEYPPLLPLLLNFSYDPSAPPPPAEPPIEQPDEDWHKHLGLYKAAKSGDWDAAKRILDQTPDAVKARVAFTLETTLHVAVGMGQLSFVEKLLQLASDDDSVLAMKTSLGYTPLHVAALTGNSRAAQLLIDRLPDLLYIPSDKDDFPVHLAAEAGDRETLELLISRTRDDLPVNPFAGDKGLALILLLIDAAFLDVALTLIDKYPDLARIRHPIWGSALCAIAMKFSRFSDITQLNLWEHFIFLRNPLEVGYLQQVQSVDMENQTCCTTLALSVAQPGPKIALCVFQTSGTTRNAYLTLLPMPVPHIKVIYERKLMHEQAVRLIKCICKYMESLRYNEAAAIYIDSVLVAAQIGCHEVIEEIVATFPPAIHSDYAATNENFLHLAVKNRCEKVFNLMYQTTNHRNFYCSRIDTSGNSILHLAASLAPPHKLNLVSGAALQMQREIQWFKEVEKFVTPYIKGQPNNAGKTPDMIFTEQHRELKVEGEKWMKDTSNSCTIAAALIVTVVFAAAITVPGGNDSDTGYPMFWENSAFTIFAVSDAVSLFTSATSLLMFLSILTSRYAEEDFLYALPKRLSIGLVTLFVSILFMMVAFSSTVYLVFGRKKAWVLVPVAALTCLPITSFVLLQFPLLLAVISSTYGRGIFGKQSDRPFH